MEEEKMWILIDKSTYYICGVFSSLEKTQEAIIDLWWFDSSTDLPLSEYEKYFEIEEFTIDKVKNLLLTKY